MEIYCLLKVTAENLSLLMCRFVSERASGIDRTQDFQMGYSVREEIEFKIFEKEHYSPKSCSFVLSTLELCRLFC